MERKLTNQEWAVLVNKAQQGDEDGFEELYRASYNYLYAVCLNGNVPEENIPDVLQEAYIKIFKNIGSLADPEKFLSWASTVVRNTGRDKGRSQKIYYERNEFMEEISTDENAGLDAFAVDELDPGYNPGVALEKAAIVQIVRDMIAEQTAYGFGKKAAAGFAQTAVAKAAVAGLILVIGSGALYFGLKGKEPQETVAETAVQEQAAEDNRESETASLQTDGAEAEGMAQAVTEAQGEQEWMEPEEPTEVPEPEEQETGRNLLDQIPELDRAVAEMVPTIKSYIDTVRKHGNREFSVNDAEQYWGFVHVYCIRQPNYFSDDMYLGVVSRGEIEEASRAAFPDFTGIPDTLDEYGPSKWTESGVDEDTVRMPLGNSQEYYQMSEWSRTDDGNGIDVTIDVYYVPDDSWWTSYTVHLIPVREAVENDARLKFFITGIEED